MNWHTRLTQAREAKKIKKSAFAKLVGVSAPTVTDWENGETKMLEGSNLIKVCNALEVSPDWLLHGVENIVDLYPGAVRVVPADQASSYRIPKVTLRLQAGITGFQTEPDRRDGGMQEIPRSWVDRKRLDPANLLAIEVRGESMEPTFYEGDTVVINIADKSPQDNGVFAVNYDGEAVVKRLSRDMGSWWLMSDNLDQKKYYRRMCTGAECIIIGRIVFRQGDHF